MFRRSTKLTALLVAAASVASMTPVMAAEKLNQKDATVYTAVAYDDGKYAYYGYRTDDDETGIYYNSGSGKDKKVEDLDDYEIAGTKSSKYGTKYMWVTEDGNKDEYLVDLSTGKILDDETREGQLSTAKSKLISNVKKSERYNKTSDDSYGIKAADIDAEQIFTAQFGDVYYQYVTTSSATTSTSVTGGINGEAKITNGYFGDYDEEQNFYTGFFNEKGKYIDASYTANLKIYNERKHKATVVEKFGKIYKDEALRVNLKSIKPLAQDKDYLYVFTTVDVEYFPEISAGKYDFNANVAPLEQYFIQKISKAQGDKVDGAYVPKSVEAWQVERNGNEIYESDGDRNLFYDVLTGVSDGRDQDTLPLYAVKGDYLYTVQINKLGSSDEKAKVFKFKLTHEKLDVVNSALHGAIDVDTKIIKKDADADTETYNGLASVSIDVDGNIWTIGKGKIKMFDSDGFKDKYSTDRSYDELDVYDKDSLIAWNHDTDSYTTVKEGKEQTVNDAKEIDPSLGTGTENGAAVKTGWEQQADGTWVLYDATGNKTTGWANVSGVWYYMDAAGIMKTGWVNDNGTWYYCNASGAMQTGWLQDGGTWYYLQSNGAMKTGWLQDGSNWYYLKSNGAMAANETIDGYYVNASGAWVK